jgi:hypothetical protein
MSLPDMGTFVPPVEAELLALPASNITGTDSTVMILISGSAQSEADVALVGVGV